MKLVRSANFLSLLALLSLVPLMVVACGQEATPTPAPTAIALSDIEKTVRDAVAASATQGTDPEDIRQMVEAAVAASTPGEGLTESDVREIVESAVASIPEQGLSEEEIRAIVESAVVASSEAMAMAEPVTHSFVDVTGTVREVPTHPQRIVAIHDGNGGAHILSLGAPLVGISTRGGEINQDILKHFDISGLSPSGDYREPDIEAILALEPDLIVGSGFRGRGQDQWFGDEIQKRLEAIAPVVYIDTFRPVDVVMQDFAYLLGPDYLEVYTQQKAEFEALMGELQDVFGEDWAKITASQPSRHATAGGLRAIGPEASSINNLLSRMGVNWVSLNLEAGSPANGGFLSLSTEQIREFDADLVHVNAYWEQTLLEEPLFKSLEAVKQGQVIVLYPEDDSFWGSHYPNYKAAVRWLIDAVKEVEPGFNFDIIVEEVEE